MADLVHVRLSTPTRGIGLTVLLLLLGCGELDSSLTNVESGGAGEASAVASFTIGGTISGLSGTVVLQNNAGNDLTINSDTLTDNTFTFDTPIEDGGTYEVTVLTQPSGQTCSISHGVGTVSTADISDVTVVCAANTYTVGGTLSGLSAGQTVVLQNNSGDNLSLTADGSFVFSTSVADGAAYAVSVLTSPSGTTCSVGSGSGTISGANVSGITVVCSTITYTVAGTLSGLGSGKTVVLQNNSSDNLTLTANGSFTFSTSVASGATYSVTVGTQPSDQTCVVTNSSGTVSSNVTTVSVACTTSTYTIGGTLSGLGAGKTLVLQNNSGDDLSLTSNGAYTFATSLENGAAYSVSVLTQPTSQTCGTNSGSGTVASANVTTANFDCGPTPGTDIVVEDASRGAIAISWGAASDTITAVDALEYKVVISTDSANLDTITEADALTGANLVMDWTAATLATTANSLSSSTSYAIAVLVRDAFGQKGFYPVATQTTLAGLRLFITTSTYSGNLGGVSGADTKCSADASKPDLGTYKAVITDGATRVACSVSNCGGGYSQSDWVLGASTTYVRLDNTTIGTTGTTKIFSFSLTNAISGTADTYWTGFISDWRAVSDSGTCTDWTVSTAGGTPAGKPGIGNSATSSAISTTNQNCDTSAHILCAEQ